MKTPKIELITEKSKIEEGASQTVEVLVRITPPDIETPSERPQMNLSLVLDRSGSMGGEKIEQAKDAAAYCVDQLLPADRLSLVIFDQDVETLIPSAPASSPELHKRLIRQIHARGSTALHEAWVRGGIEVSEFLDATRVNRVVLITDGQANVGETRTGTIVRQTAELARRGVSTSTIGIGRDFNEELLVPMAEAGQGNAWHVEHAADMARIFESELGGALNQVGREVSMRVVPAAGVRIADVMNDFERDADGRHILPNLIGGKALEIVVAVTVPAACAGDSLSVFEIELEYTDQRSAVRHAVSAGLTFVFGTADEVASLPENHDVNKAVVLLANARARAEAIRRMDVGDFAGARDRVRSAVAASQAMFSIEPSAELEDELAMLKSDLSDLDLRDADVMTRKKMMYAARYHRKGR